MLDMLLGALLIFCLRVVDVSLGTIRVILTIRGRKFPAAAIGFVEISIFLVAISKVLTNIGNWWNVIGYSGGFATGTLLGIMLEEKLALGTARVSIFSTSKGHEIADALRKDGFGATELFGAGQDSPVSVVNAVVRRREVSQVMTVAHGIDKGSFITVEETRHVYRGRWRVAK